MLGFHRIFRFIKAGIAWIGRLSKKYEICEYSEIYIHLPLDYRSYDIYSSDLPVSGGGEYCFSFLERWHKAQVSKYIQQHTNRRTITKPQPNPMKNPIAFRAWLPGLRSFTSSAETVMINKHTAIKKLMKEFIVAVDGGIAFFLARANYENL